MLEPKILPICVLTKDLVNQHDPKQIHWAKDTLHPDCFSAVLLPGIRTIKPPGPLKCAEP